MKERLNLTLNYKNEIEILTNTIQLRENELKELYEKLKEINYENQVLLKQKNDDEQKIKNLFENYESLENLNSKLNEDNERLKKDFSLQNSLSKEYKDLKEEHNQAIITNQQQEYKLHNYNTERVDKENEINLLKEKYNTDIKNNQIEIEKLNKKI